MHAGPVLTSAEPSACHDNVHAHVVYSSHPVPPPVTSRVSLFVIVFTSLTRPLSTVRKTLFHARTGEKLESKQEVGVIQRRQMKGTLPVTSNDVPTEDKRFILISHLAHRVYPAPVTRSVSPCAEKRKDCYSVPRTETEGLLQCT